MTGNLEVAATYGDALRTAIALLRATRASETPELDAQVLLAHITGEARARLLAYPERALTPAQAGAFAALIQRRAAREPIAYLTGHREFMGLDFLTDPRALI
ncbi:MAG: peptide chain release factor N(5)-glutamine methyltransferase, partial [Ktedonobacterales bacterium]